MALYKKLSDPALKSSSKHAMFLNLYIYNYYFPFSENISERFYVALYKKLSDPALKSSSKHAMFLNLLYKSLIKDISERRVKVCLTLKSPPKTCSR